MKKKTSPKKLKRLSRLLLALILLIFIGSSGTYIAYAERRDHVERGQYNVADIYVGENPYKSLDLKVAGKSAFPSNPITIDKELDAADGLRHQLFKYDVKNDGISEYGLMVRPADPPPPNGYPVLILLHGFMDPDRYSTPLSYLSDADTYAKQGFLVLKPDLRGQGASFDSAPSDSAYFSMSYNTDVMSLISAAKKTKYIDKSNINLWGHSMGAYIALRTAVLSPDIKNTIIRSGPVDSLEEMYLTYIPPSDENNPYALATRNDVFAKYGTPADNTAFWHDASPINFVSKIKGNIQIHVGSADEVVPPEFSADLNAALSKAHVRHQYYIYPDGRHSLAPERSLIYERSVKAMKPVGVQANQPIAE
jgi:dipeptidyl aminopeptidase/acylaminoacyl peptidase